MTWKLGITAVLLVSMAGLAAGFHGPTGTRCVATGPDPNVLNDPAIKVLQGEVSVANPAETWTLELGPGTHYLVAAFPWDADISVCREGATTHACVGGNIVFVPDTCAGSIAGNPGSGRPITGPGTFRLDVIYCWASVCYDLDPSLDQPIGYTIVVV